jgi:anaerobic ribonucleoside-triphosphate reductase
MSGHTDRQWGHAMKYSKCPECFIYMEKMPDQYALQCPQCKLVLGENVRLAYVRKMAQQ